MDRFTIRDIENLCGIKAHTLRIWEKRYSIISPKRKDSNHRIYDSDDLKHWLQISYLYHRGVKISRIASMTAHDLKKEATRKISSTDKYQHYINELTESSIGFDTNLFENTFNQCLAKMGIENTIVNVLYPYLEKIGLLWLTDHIIPAQEHFSSNIITHKLIVAIDDLKIRPSAHARKILLYTPAGEHHEIPLLFSQYLLKQNGDKVIYFGANITVDKLESYVGEKPVTYILLHWITVISQADITDYVEKLAARFPEITIIVSGPKAAEIINPSKNVRLLLSMQALLKFCKE